DWKMPGLNGQQVYEKLRTTNPTMSERIIFITGDLISERTRKFLEAQNKICLPKPFTLTEFHSAINNVLLARAAAEAPKKTEKAEKTEKSEKAEKIEKA